MSLESRPQTPAAGASPPFAAGLNPGGRAAGRVARSPGPDARTWTIEMPAGMELLSLNGRYHWSKRSRITEALKEAACWMARKGHIPRLACVSIVVEYQPPDSRRRDPDNAATASGKPCIDGIVLAGVLEDDSSEFVTHVTYRIGEPYPRGRLVLFITEVP